KRPQDRRTLLRRNIEPAECRRALGPQHIAAPPLRDRARCDDLGRLAAAEVEHQSGRDLEPVFHKCRVDAALEAVARIARYTQPAAGRGGAPRVEQRRLDEDLGSRLGAAGGLAADHAAKALHPGPVGDRSYLGVESILLTVESEKGLAGPRKAHGQIPL